MEEYPGAELSLSQLVDALEKRLSLMTNYPLSDTILDEEEINRAIPKLSSISASVRQLKNSLAPVNRLPPEVITLALTFRESDRDLISATAVCKYWRRTLVSTPALWNKIVCSQWENPGIAASYVQAYFERSRSFPVDVQIHSCASKSHSSYTGRISSLRIILDHPSNLDDIAEHLSKPAPILETISLHVKDWDQPTLVLLSTFFKAIRSSVRTLTLCGATLSPGPRRFSQLTKCILETHSTASAPSVALLDTLERMPLLRLFRAKRCCARRPDDIPEGRVVTLPHLEDITITTDEGFRGPLASPIFPALCLPSAHRVVMRSIGAFCIIHTPILPLSFEERLPALSATPEVSVALGREFNIEFFGPRRSKLTFSVNSMMPFTFRSSIDPTIPFACARSTFGGVPFGSVRKLRVCLPNRVDPVSFVAMLRAVGGLDWLEVEGNTGESLAHWAEVDDQAEICPALATLVVDITDVDIKETKYCIRGLEQARERAGVPIPCVGIGYRRDWVPVGF